MKTFLIIATCLVSAVLFSAQQVNCANEIGVEFLKEFKKYGIELFKTKLQIWQQFAEELLKDSKPTAEEKADILNAKNSLTEMLAKVDNMNEAELIEAIYKFVDESYVRRYFPEAKDCENAKKVDQALFKSYLESEVAAFKFVINISAAWKKLYKQIPAEELKNKQGYGNINNLLEAAINSKGKAADVYKLCEELVKFFNNKDWLYILGISKEGKRAKGIIN